MTPPKNTTAKEILAQVERITGVTVAELVSDYRTNRICLARYMAVLAIRRAFPQWALLDVAIAVGRKSHRSAILALSIGSDMMNDDARFRAAVEEIMNEAQESKEADDCKRAPQHASQPITPAKQTKDINLISAQALARILSCTPRYVHMLHETGCIPGYGFGKYFIRFNITEVLDAIRMNAKKKEFTS